MKHLLFTIILRWTSSSVWIFASSALQAFTLNRLFYLKLPISSGRDLNLFHTLQLHHSLIILASFLCTSLWQPTLPHKLWDDSSSLLFSTLSTPRVFSSQLFSSQSTPSTHYGFSILHSALSFLIDSSPQISSPLIQTSPECLPPKTTHFCHHSPFRYLSFSLFQSYHLRTHFFLLCRQFLLLLTTTTVDVYKHLFIIYWPIMILHLPWTSTNTVSLPSTIFSNSQIH